MTGTKVAAMTGDAHAGMSHGEAADRCMARAAVEPSGRTGHEGHTMPATPPPPPEGAHSEHS